MPSLQETVSSRIPARGWGEGFAGTESAPLIAWQAEHLRATTARVPSLDSDELASTVHSTQASDGSGRHRPALSLPAVIGGRYEARRLIGRGGMGAVYLTIDRHLVREVALKIVTRSTKNSRERFRREGLIAVGLDHPGIVRALGGGEHRDQPYIVYELVRGAHTLCQVFPHAELERRVGLVLDTARALAFAHERGVIHRDVKLENVLVDITGRARVTDFGLASARGLPPITEDGKVIGTPAAMSPEQVRGRRATPASDVWGLGVLLYHALVLESPFQAESVADLAVEIASAKVQAPRELDPYVPRGIERVCLRALSKHADDRYPDGGAFVRALERALRRPTVWDRVRYLFV